MASDELRLLIGVPETIARGALPQLRRHKEPFARLPIALRPSRPVQQWVFHRAEKRIDNFPGAALWLVQKKVV